MAKRKLSPTLRAWNMCRLKLGVKPFEKATAQQKAALRECVEERTGTRAKRGKKPRRK